jgi:hypothetical protein
MSGPGIAAIECSGDTRDFVARIDAAGEDVVGVDGADGHEASVVAIRGEVGGAGLLRPRVAAIGAAIEPVEGARVAQDAGVHHLRARLAEIDIDGRDTAGGQAVGKLDVGVAAIGRAVHALAGAAEVERAGRDRVEHDGVGGAGELRGPRGAAVGGTDVSARAGHMDDLRVERIDGDARDLRADLGRGRDLRPVLARVIGSEDAVARVARAERAGARRTRCLG